MDQLNQRQIELLRLLISDNSYKPIKNFAHTLGVSNKTISWDLDEIQSFIEKTGSTLERKSGSGVKLHYDDAQLFQLVEIINSHGNINEQISVEQRRAEIARSLLLNSKEYTTIQKLSNQYYVSRTSILNDLKYIEDQFREFNIKIIRTRDGTRISAKEMDIRNALAYVIQENIHYNSNYLIEYQILRHNENNIEGLDEVDEIKFFENLLNGLESDMKRIIYEPYYTNLLTHLLIMTKRIREGNDLEEIRGSNDRLTEIDSKIYKGVFKIVNQIENHYDIKIADNEVFYIYQYLISSGLRNKDNQISKPSDELEALSKMFTRKLIAVISDMSEKDFNYDNKLFQSLLLHIKPMLNRLVAGIKIKNPLLDEITTEFSEFFTITRIACMIVCDMLEIENISLDEVAYIMTYFQYEIEKSNSNKQAIVICHSGYGTSQLLATRLRKSFANLNISDVIASSKLNRVDLDDIDLIISTVKLNIDKPYVLVSAFLGEADIKNIQHLIDNQSLGEKNNKQKEIFEDVVVNNTYNYKKETDLPNILKKNQGIEFNKNEMVCLNETICIYPYKTNEKSTLLLTSIDKENKDIYVIKYDNHHYLISIVKKIISNHNKQKSP